MAKKDRNIEEITFFGFQNTDISPEHLPKGDYFYSLNITNNSSGVGDRAIIKNIKGNLKIPFDLPDGINKCIGVADDSEVNKFYFFVWNSNRYDGIYQFDALTKKVNRALLNIEDTGGLDITRFDPGFLILHANVIHNDLLYWVDGKNPARKVNISKLFDKSQSGYGPTILESFINAYKKTAAFPPTAVYFSDTSKPFNRFYGRLTKYAYRYIYDDGEKSCYSDFSSVVLPDNELFNGLNTITTNNNGIKITLNTGDRIVKRIEIIMQSTAADPNEETLGLWVLIAVIDKRKLKLSDYVDYTYAFYNEGNYPVIIQSEVIQPYSFIPTNPLCQTYIKNRLIYAGGYEGFDNDNIDVDIDVSYFDLFIPDGTEEKWNSPKFLYGPTDPDYVEKKKGVIRHDDMAEIMSSPYRFNKQTLTIGNDVKKGNVFTYTAGNGYSADQVLISYTALATDTAITVANALKLKLITTGLIYKWTPDIPGISDIYQNIVDGDGNVTFTFIIKTRTSGKGYLNGNTHVGPVQYNVLKDSGQVIGNIKMGSTIKLGIEYEDFDGRKSAVYTSDAIVVAIKPVNSEGLKAPVITLQINHKAPKWAWHYQIMRTNDLRASDFIQMLIQNVVEVPTNNSANYLDLVVGSLFTYQKLHPNTTLKYQFEKGDRLQLLKRTSNNTYYPFFETEIISYSEYVRDKVTDNIITDGTNTVKVSKSSASNIGKYLIIEGSEREIIAVPNSTSYVLNNKIGDITSKTYLYYELEDRRGTLRIVQPPSDIVIENYSTVEIYKPSKSNPSDETYFAFQKKFPIINPGTDNALHAANKQNQSDSLPALVEISEGTVYVRNREMPISNVLPNTQVIIEKVEDPSYSDFYISNINDNGRANAEDTGQGRVRLGSRMRHSNKFIEGSSINGLNYFENLSRQDYNDNYGDIKLIKADGDRLLVFKQLITGWVPIYGRITQDKDNLSLLVTSPNFLNDFQSYDFEGGIGNHPESFASNASHKYFAIADQGIIVRLGGNGIEPISKTFHLDKKAKEILTKASINGARIFGGFDNKNDHYIITIEGYDEYIYFDGLTGWKISKPISGDVIFELLSEPNHGTLTFTTPTKWRYLNDADYIGVDSFSYRAKVNDEWTDAQNVCIDIIPSLNKITAWRKKEGSEFCVTYLGFRTGYQGWATLEEYDVVTGALTGNEKPNIEGDGDYIYPELNEEACEPQQIFWNVKKEQSYTKQCDDDAIGTLVKYTVPANKYYGATQEAADAQAQAEMDANGQANANEIGDCVQIVFWNDMQQKVFRKQCGGGQLGESFTYKIGAHLFSAHTKAEANALAIAALNAGGQAWANSQPGGCENLLVPNDPQSRPFVKQCGPGYQGSTFIYTVPSGAHWALTKTEANQKALNDVLAYGQTWANSQVGGCTQVIFWNTLQSKIFTKECEDPLVGTTVEYIVYPGTYSASTQAEANQKAIDEINLKGQANANTFGKCLSSVVCNEEQSDTFYKEGCDEDHAPTETEVTVLAGQYCDETLELANAQALAWIAAHGQEIANEEGDCIQIVFWNEETRRSIQRNDCTSGYVGTFVEYIVPAHRYSGPTQEDANAEAEAEIDDLGQAWANDPDNGAICVPPESFGNQAFIGNFFKSNCESGFPTVFRYTYAANQIYASTQEEADDLAEIQFNLLGQDFADNDPRGTCHPTISGSQPCGEVYLFNGGFPATPLYIPVADMEGYITLAYDTFLVPDKMIVEIEGVGIVSDSGYRGDISYQDALDDALADMSLPSEPIVGDSIGSVTFYKPITSNALMTILMYMPIPGSEASVNVGCVNPPVGNDERCDNFYSELCVEPNEPIAYPFCISANEHYAATKETANALADAQLLIDGQEAANEFGECQPPCALSASFGKTDESTLSGNNGTITITTTGATGVLEFSKDGGSTWVSGTSPLTFTGLVPGSYSVKVKDEICEKGSTVVIGAFSCSLSIGTSKTDETIALNDGSITITVTNGTGTLQFSKDNGSSWSSGASPYEFTGLSPDIYQIKVKDESNCVVGTSVTIMPYEAEYCAFVDDGDFAAMYGDDEDSGTACAMTLGDDEATGTSEGLFTINPTCVINIGDTLYYKVGGVYYPWDGDPIIVSYIEEGVRVWISIDNTGEVTDKGECNSCDLEISFVSKTNESAPGAEDGSITINGSTSYEDGFLLSKNAGASFPFPGTSPYTFTGLAPGVYSIHAINGDGSCETSIEDVEILDAGVEYKGFWAIVQEDTGSPPPHEWCANSVYRNRLYNTLNKEGEFNVGEFIYNTSSGGTIPYDGWFKPPGDPNVYKFSAGGEIILKVPC